MLIFHFAVTFIIALIMNFDIKYITIYNVSNLLKRGIYMFDKNIKEHKYKTFLNDELKELEIDNIKFEHCNFKGNDLSYLITRNCTFMCCNFSLSSLNGSRHINSSFINCQFSNANLFSAVFKDCKCSGSGFVDAQLIAIEIIRGNFDYCNFSYCDFSKMVLQDISFKNADLKNTDFRKSVVKNCNFTNAVLSGAKFNNADIRESILDGVYLKDVHFGKTKIDIEQAVLISQSMGAYVY